MDDALKLKIAASLDLPTDAAADPDVARALDDDPEARAYARDLHTLDHALRAWPKSQRTDAEWERFAARLDAKLEEAAKERAKVRKGKKVSNPEPDPAAVPVFEDGSTQAPESKLVMSEPQENDADLENLAALTRTSTVPSGVPVTSVRPSLTDAVDDTSSGIVDIKKLAEMARAEAEKPAAKAESAPAPKPEPEAEKPAAKLASSSKNNDVMVTPKVASPVALDEPAPRKGGSTLWGAIGGMALMAGAFALYTNMQHPNASEPTSAASNDGTAATATATPSGSATTPAVPAAQSAAAQPAAPPPPQPESAPLAQNAAPPAEPAPTAAPVAAQPPPPPAPTPAADERAAVAHRASAPTTATASARAAAPAPAMRDTAEREAPATPPAREQHAAAPTPTSTAPAAPARPAAAAAPPASSTGGARSVDDLMARVAGGGGAPAAAAPAADTTAELPERPTRSQITSVLSGLNGAVRSCTNGQTGTAPVSLVIMNDGTVSQANVSGQFGGSAAGECISGVVRRAHFPRFRAQQVSLTYPFVILPPR